MAHSPSKTDAQHKADRMQAFREELAELQRNGILELDDAQRQALDAHYAAVLAELTQSFDIDQTVEAKQLSLGMRVASFLGALALAASVFFLFRQFWGTLSAEYQVSILVAAPLLTFAGAMLTAARDRTGYFAKLIGMVSFACFVLNLSMLGQIFNITPSDNALLVWAAFALLLAYALESGLLLTAGILCLTAFVGARTGTWGGGYWLYFGERPENFFPAALLLFLIPQFVSQQRYGGFAAIYRVFGLLTLLLPVLVLANWGMVSYLDLDSDIIEGGYQVLGFVVSALAIWLGVRNHWRGVTNTGITFFVIFLYTKFFDWWWDIMPKYLFFLVIGLTAVLFLFVFKRWRSSARPVAGVTE